jgi:hypothetical protein
MSPALIDKITCGNPEPSHELDYFATRCYCHTKERERERAREKRERERESLFVFFPPHPVFH